MSPAKHGPGSSSSMSSKPRVLVVDDCETSLLFQGLALSTICDVMEARDGRQALAITAHGDIDLVVLDLNLPDLDGLEVLRELRRIDPGRRIPVVVVTLRADAETRGRAQRDGCAEYLTKPVSSGRLQHVVNLHLRH